MTTNVQPGDMALIMKATKGYQWTVGRIVEIDSACCFSVHTAAWKFKKRLVHRGMAIGCAPDAFLKRIPPLTDEEAKEERARDAMPAEKEADHALVTFGGRDGHA